VKKIGRTIVVLAVALFALASLASPALATSPSATDLTTAGQRMRPDVDTAIFGIDLSGNSLTTVSTVHVDFAQYGSDTDFDISDLQASPDGVVLWRDSSNATPETQDVLDAGDQRLSTSFTFSGLRANLTISPAWHLPAADPSEGNYTLLLSVQLSDSVANGDDFIATLPSDAFVTNIPILGFTAVSTHVITADPTAPTVLSFAPAVAQTDNIYWQLSESVVGVSASTVVFRLHGTTTDVPATVSYDDAAHKITVHPTAPLTAGQSYDADLLPDGPGAITDLAGNELAPDPETFRGATTVSETAPGSAYAWRALSNSSSYNGSYWVNNMPGASAAYAFSGSSLVWYTVKDPYQGVASVTIDGHSKGTFNNYASTATYKVARSFTGLGSGPHTISIRVTGTKGSSSGRDVRVSIDAFKDSGTYKGTPTMSFRWASVSNSMADGGSYRAARFSGTYMTFVFRGTSIDWRTVLGPGMGRALVYVDGVSKGTFDNYSGVTITKYLRHIGGLTDAVHTLKIMVSATRNASASDSVLVVDGFLIDSI